MIVGIDNGACTGAAAAINQNGELLGYTTLPNHKVNNKTEIDLKSFRSWIEVFDTAPVLVAIEEPLAFAPSSQAVRSMAMCYGQLYGLCVGAGWPVTGVGVKKWQKDVLGKFPQGQSKKYAEAKASELLPKETWIDPRKPKARCAHDGIIDAYLIAHYMWQQNN